MINNPCNVLTQRQLEIIALVANGDTYQIIASKKFLSRPTIMRAISDARDRVGVSSIQELLLVCFEFGAIQRSEFGYVPVVDPEVVG